MTLAAVPHRLAMLAAKAAVVTSPPGGGRDRRGGKLTTGRALILRGNGFTGAHPFPSLWPAAGAVLCVDAISPSR